MEDLALHTGAPTEHWEDNTSCIYVVESKRVTPRVKHVDITVCFIQEKFENVIFIPEYDMYSVMPADICTKPYSGSIISWIAKCMNGFR